MGHCRAGIRRRTNKDQCLSVGGEVMGYLFSTTLLQAMSVRAVEQPLAGEEEEEEMAF